MDTGTKHVVSLLRALADDIETGRAVYFEVKTDAGAYQQRPLGLTAAERAFQRFEIKAEVNPNAPRRCPACRNALLEGKCVTVECPVDAQDPGPFMWHITDDLLWHTDCGGQVVDVDGRKRCVKCGETS